MPDKNTANKGTANNDSSHYFHAEAYALSGKLLLPFEEQIKKQAYVKLEGDSPKVLLEGRGDNTGQGEETKKLREKRAQENYLSQHAKNYRLEGIISYSAAHTQVSGHRSKKHSDRFVTLATSTIENLNILNVVTADRVVAQISTTHRQGQYLPEEVTFIGTHFEDLRIARHKATPVLNLALAGKAPVKDGKVGYYPTAGSKLMASIKKQYQRLGDAYGEVKTKIEEEYLSRLRADDSWYSKQYHQFDYAKLEQDAEAAIKNVAAPESPADNGAKWEGVTCSLVEQVEIADTNDIKLSVKNSEPIVIPPHLRHFGHVLQVPDFGTIFLGELKVKHDSFHLTMIRLELGCVAEGGGSFASCTVNGGHKPGGP